MSISGGISVRSKRKQEKRTAQQQARHREDHPSRMKQPGRNSKRSTPRPSNDRHNRDQRKQHNKDKTKNQKPNKDRPTKTENEEKDQSEASFIWHDEAVQTKRGPSSQTHRLVVLDRKEVQKRCVSSEVHLCTSSGVPINSNLVPDSNRGSITKLKRIQKRSQSQL